MLILYLKSRCVDKLPYKMLVKKQQIVALLMSTDLPASGSTGSIFSSMPATS